MLFRLDLLECINILSLMDCSKSERADEMMLKASHVFNLLDARHAISVTERQRYILRVRALSKGIAEAYYTTRESLGFPILDNVKEVV